MTDQPVDQRRAVAHWWPVLAQLVGLAAIAVGFGLWAVWAGVVAFGVLAVAAGTVAEMEQRR